MNENYNNIRKAIIVSYINNKGGVAKTTSVAVTAELLAYIGCKVLVIDLDEQSNLSLFFHSYIEDDEDTISGLQLPETQNIYELFKYRYRTAAEVKAIICSTNIAGVDIIPSSKRHARTPLELTLNTGNNNIVLRRALNTVKTDYDFILIDNAPASNILTVNSIFASDYIITPVKPEQYSLKGLKETLTSILYIKEEHDLEDINFLGAFITQADLNTNAFKSGKELLSESLNGKVFSTAIRKDTKINEINQSLVPLLGHGGEQSNALIDYARLLLEMHILDIEKEERLRSCIE